MCRRGLMRFSGCSHSDSNELEQAHDRSHRYKESKRGDCDVTIFATCDKERSSQKHIDQSRRKRYAVVASYFSAVVYDVFERVRPECLLRRPPRHSREMAILFTRVCGCSLLRRPCAAVGTAGGTSYEPHGGSRSRVTTFSLSLSLSLCCVRTKNPLYSIRMITKGKRRKQAFFF
jgi:hypothetical protein